MTRNETDAHVAFAKILVEMREARKVLETLMYERALIECPECKSIRVVVVGTTDKRVKYVCKDCGREFQKSKKNVEKEIKA